MEEQLALSYPFAHKAYKEFYENEDEVQKTREWETLRSETMRGVRGTIEEGFDRGKPQYQIQENMGELVAYGGSMVRRSRCGKFLAILPQHLGEEDDPATPYNLEHIKHAISPRGLLSPCHVIVIPNPEHADLETKRRYANAMTLKKEDIPMLDIMEELLFETMDILIEGPAEMIGSLRWWLSRKDTDMIRTDSGMEFEQIDVDDFKANRVQNFLDLKDASRGSFEKRIQYLKENKFSSFHLASRDVNWLNMHGWIKPLETVNFEMLEREALLEGNEKQTSVSTVRVFIQSGGVESFRSD